MAKITNIKVVKKTKNYRIIKQKVKFEDGTLPRYRFDYCFDTKISINDAKKILWKSFNGKVIWSQGKLKPVWERSHTISRHHFNMSNIVEGSFSWGRIKRFNIKYRRY